MKFRTRFHQKKVQLHMLPGEGRTKPEFQDECDINKIMERYKKTGILPQSALNAAARYGDFSNIPSYQEMFDRVHAANDLFMALPAKVREQFGNDPQAFIEHSQTLEGQKLLVTLGLATKRQTEANNSEINQNKISKTPDDSSIKTTPPEKEASKKADK